MDQAKHLKELEQENSKLKRPPVANRCVISFSAAHFKEELLSGVRPAIDLLRLEEYLSGDACNPVGQCDDHLL